jgi:hypothetical protein
MRNKSLITGMSAAVLLLVTMGAPLTASADSHNWNGYQNHKAYQQYDRRHERNRYDNRRHYAPPRYVYRAPKRVYYYAPPPPPPPRYYYHDRHDDGYDDFLVPFVIGGVVGYYLNN